MFFVHRGPLLSVIMLLLLEVPLLKFCSLLPPPSLSHFWLCPCWYSLAFNFENKPQENFPKSQIVRFFFYVPQFRLSSPLAFSARKMLCPLICNTLERRTGFWPFICELLWRLVLRTKKDWYMNDTFNLLFHILLFYMWTVLDCF